MGNSGYRKGHRCAPGSFDLARDKEGWHEQADERTKQQLPPKPVSEIDTAHSIIILPRSEIVKSLTPLRQNILPTGQAMLE